VGRHYLAGIQPFWACRLVSAVAACSTVLDQAAKTAKSCSSAQIAAWRWKAAMSPQSSESRHRRSVNPSANSHPTQRCDRLRLGRLP
jgi:hypothetical protein